MKWRGNVVDVSSFLLVEASGDSEADLNSGLGAAGGGEAGNINAVADQDDDDAESCSCDRNGFMINGCGSRGYGDHHDDCHESDDDNDYDLDGERRDCPSRFPEIWGYNDDGDEEEGEANSHRRYMRTTGEEQKTGRPCSYRRCGGGASKIEAATAKAEDDERDDQKLKGYGDSAKDAMNDERERNRLFWESCLAS